MPIKCLYYDQAVYVASCQTFFENPFTLIVILWIGQLCVRPTVRPLFCRQWARVLGKEHRPNDTMSSIKTSPF